MKKILSVVFGCICALISLAENADFVACAGRIIPAERVQKLAAPSPTGAQAVIKQMNVKAGDVINKGDIVAVIAGEDTALASVNSARAALQTAMSTRDVRVMQQKNMQADIEGEIQQIKNVLLEKDPPRREREELEYQQTSLMRKLAHIRVLTPLIEKNEDNIVAQAKTALDEAIRVLNSYYVKAPISGRVLEMHVKQGEAVSMEGICEIANIAEIFVEAEVYVADIAKVKVGQKAQITSDALVGKIYDGSVVSISRTVKSNKFFSSDPSDFSNLRVVRVKIKLNNPDAFKTLIGSQVNVRIFTK